MSDGQVGEEDEQMPELVNLAENDDVIMFDDLLNEVEEEEKTKEEDNDETDKKVEEKACYYGKETKPTEKYVRPMPPLVEPYLQENLVEMNGQKHHAFKFIDDSGYITNDSLLSFIDMPKKTVKVRVEKGKKGRMVDQKLSLEEKAEKLIHGFRDASCQWPLKSNTRDGRPLFYSGIVTERKTLRVVQRQVSFKRNTKFTRAEQSTLTKMLSGSFERRDELMKSVMEEMKKRKKSRYYSHQPDVDEDEKVLPGLFNRILGPSTASATFIEYEDDADDEHLEFARKLADLRFANPKRNASNPVFYERYGQLIEKEHAAFVANNYVMSHEFDQLRQVSLNPTLAAMRLYSG